MNKRAHTLKEDDIDTGEAPRKTIKRAQTANLEQNLLSSPKKNQTQLTTFFSSNKTTPTRNVKTDEEEQKRNSQLDRQTTATEEILEENDSDLSYYSDGQEEAEKKKVNQKKVRDMPNVLFYLNVTQSRPQGDYIDNIHKYWKEDYRKLEIHHGYVQWLFPNFYGSAFNRDAFKLTLDEAKIFRENQQIAERLVLSYEMMLGFYGMKIADRKTGKLERAENYEERYKATLITSLHNHLRVRRILAHLNVVGFRAYAIELVDFLETEMFGEKGGYQKHLDEPRPLQIEYIKKIKSNPLFAIIKYDVFHEWKMYGEVNTPEEIKKLHKNCFTSDEKDYEPSILLRAE